MRVSADSRRFGNGGGVLGLMRQSTHSSKGQSVRNRNANDLNAQANLLGRRLDALLFLVALFGLHVVDWLVLQCKWKC